MCRRVSCSKCGKPSWAGCGAHVEQVLGNVPKSERCQCRETASKNRGAEAPAGQRSWLSKLILGG
jgi:hypothetical protein